MRKSFCLAGDEAQEKPDGILLLFFFSALQTVRAGAIWAVMKGEVGKEKQESLRSAGEVQTHVFSLSERLQHQQCP